MSFTPKRQLDNEPWSVDFNVLALWWIMNVSLMVLSSGVQIFRAVGRFSLTCSSWVNPPLSNVGIILIYSNPWSDQVEMFLIRTSRCLNLCEEEEEVFLSAAEKWLGWMNVEEKHSIIGLKFTLVIVLLMEAEKGVWLFDGPSWLFYENS